MDAISMLKDDHRSVERLFKRFEQAGDDAYREKREIADRIIEELSVHAAIEEQVFYPVTRETVPSTEDTVLESLEEHHVVKWVLSELEGMDPEDERFDAKVTVLMESVRHHVEEEEQEYFPKVRDELGRNALAELGDALAAAKEAAPTKPMPKAPDEPPGNLLIGTAAGMATRVGDTVSGLAQDGMSALSDLVSRIMDRKQPKKSTAKRSAAKKATAKRSAAKKAAARKSTARKSAPRKATARKSAARKSTAKRASAPRKSAARKSTARKSTARKSTARKSTARKSTARKSTARKSTARKSPARKSPARRSTARRSSR